MKKICFVIPLFLAISCSPELFSHMGCGMPSYEEKAEAKALLGEFTTRKMSMNPNQAKKIFGCYYYEGDEVYSYNRFMNRGYVLVRDGKAVTYHRL